MDNTLREQLEKPVEINSCQQILNNRSNEMSNRQNTKNSLLNTTYECGLSSNNLYRCNPFIEANLLTSVLGPNFGANVMDSAIGYFNHVEIYQSILQQYQNNTSLLNSNIDLRNHSNNEISKKQLDKSLLNPKIDTYSIKERPDISITPVVNNSDDFNKKIGRPSNSNNEKNISSAVTIQLSKPIKTITQHQPIRQNIHDSTSSTIQNYDNFLTKNTVFKKQYEHKEYPHSMKIFPRTKESTYSSTSNKELTLQHKLKNHQNYCALLKDKSFTKTTSVDKKILSNISDIKNKNFFSSATNTTLNKDIFSQQPKAVTFKKPGSKTAQYDTMLKSFDNPYETNSMLMLSQLKQHSHLEIIPQKEHLQQHQDKRKIQTHSKNYSEINLDSVNKSLKIDNSDKHLNRPKLKNHKEEKNSVEIITLDD